jgi:hypothetical protein
MPGFLSRTLHAVMCMECAIGAAATGLFVYYMVQPNPTVAAQVAGVSFGAHVAAKLLMDNMGGL